MNLSDLMPEAVGIAAGLAALRYIFGRLRWLFRTLDALQRVVSNELQHNGGDSIKDHATKTASTTSRIEETVNALAEALKEHIGDGHQHN